jgi:hypothetical protein
VRRTPSERSASSRAVGAALGADERALAEDLRVDLRTHKQLGTPLTGHTKEVDSVAFQPRRAHTDIHQHRHYGPPVATPSMARITDLQKDVCNLVGSGLNTTECVTALLRRRFRDWRRFCALALDSARPAKLRWP